MVIFSDAPRRKVIDMSGGNHMARFTEDQLPGMTEQECLETRAQAILYVYSHKYIYNVYLCVYIYIYIYIYVLLI